MTAETRDAVAGAAIPVPAELASVDLANVSVLMVGTVQSVKERTFTRRDGTEGSSGIVALLVGEDRIVRVEYPSLAAATAVAGASLGELVMLPVNVSGGWDKGRGERMAPSFRGAGQRWRD